MRFHGESQRRTCPDPQITRILLRAAEDPGDVEQVSAGLADALELEPSRSATRQGLTVTRLAVTDGEQRGGGLC